LVERRETKGPGLSSDVPDGLVHHWVGIIFIPGIALAELLPIMRDYDRRAELYKPDVIASHLISHQGDDYVFFLRLYQKRFTTVVFNTEYVAHWGEIDPHKVYSHSISTRITESKDADRPDGEEWPVGQGRGYLWRLNTYWRFEEKDNGVYMQCEALSLTRDIPFGLGWLLKPLVTKIPRESLNHALGQTRTAVLEKKKSWGPASSSLLLKTLGFAAQASKREVPPFPLQMQSQSSLHVYAMRTNVRCDSGSSASATTHANAKEPSLPAASSRSGDQDHSASIEISKKERRRKSFPSPL